MNIYLKKQSDKPLVSFTASKAADVPFRVSLQEGARGESSYKVNFDAQLPVAELHETLRRAASELADLARRGAVHALCLDAQKLDAGCATAFIEGLYIADYTFDRYKSQRPSHLSEVDIISSKLKQEDIERLARLYNRIWWCREWVNMPVADLNAPLWAEELQGIARELGIKCEIMDKKAIEQMGMGGLLAVNRGSVDEPRLVVMEYRGAPRSRKVPVALVGKGIMYDTGGLNIKPDDYMQEMKSDMAGAATMASVLFAVAEQNLPLNIVAVLPLTDNRPGFNAYAADDILTMYDGTTVEVVNTDAEGRLILADAIAYAVEKYNPTLLVDAATLTGAAVRTLSTYGMAAVQQNAEKEMASLQTIGEECYERIAVLPFWKEYDEMLKSDMADMKNCGPAQAGTITAGKFLAHFARKTPYIHLDIAGVAYFSKKQSPYGVGATGIGIRLLYKYLCNLCDKSF